MDRQQMMARLLMGGPVAAAPVARRDFPLMPEAPAPYGTEARNASEHVSPLSRDVPAWMGMTQRDTDRMADTAANWVTGIAGTTPLVGRGIRAFHGSPHDFDRFRMDRIGTGEGAQAYGHGLYFAEAENVARTYRDALRGGAVRVGDGTLPLDMAADTVAARVRAAVPNAQRPTSSAEWVLTAINNGEDAGAILRRINAGGWDDAAKAEMRAALEAAGDVTRNPGRMYEVNLNTAPDRLLDWSRPVAEQPVATRLPESISRRLAAHGEQSLSDWGDLGAGTKASDYATGSTLYRALSEEVGGPAEAARALRELGVDGIRYLDQGSRAAGDGTRNYVMFDDSLIDIIRKYGIAGLLMAGAGAAAPAEAGQQ
jgi:hypothetical protein